MSWGWQLVRSTILSHGWLNVLSSSCENNKIIIWFVISNILSHGWLSVLSSSCENIYIIILKLDVLFCHKLDSMFCLVPMKIFK